MPDGDVCLWVLALMYVPACMFMYLQNVRTGCASALCECTNVSVCVHERETERWWKCYDSARRQQQQQQPPQLRVDGGRGWRVHEARHLFFFFSKMNYGAKPSVCYSLYNKQQRPRPNTCGEWMGLVLQKVPDNKKAWRLWVLVYFNRLSYGILMEFCIACFALWLMQLN